MARCARWGLVYHKHFVKKAVLDNIFKAIQADILPKLQNTSEMVLVNPI